MYMYGFKSFVNGACMDIKLSGPSLTGCGVVACRLFENFFFVRHGSSMHW